MESTDYRLMYEQAAEIIRTEPHYVSALSNLSALLFQSMEGINWAGFYLMDRGSLVVGPFQGKTACIRIEIGKGVCGTAVRRMSMPFPAILPVTLPPGRKSFCQSGIKAGSPVFWILTVPCRTGLQRKMRRDFPTSCS